MSNQEPGGSEKRNTPAVYLKKNLFYFVTLFPAVAFIAAFFLIIVINLLVFSFTQYGGGEGGALANYQRVIFDPAFRQSYWRTFLFMLTVTFLQLAVGLLVASVLHRNFPGRGILRGISMIPLALPVLATASVFFILFSRNGHINALLTGQYAFFPQVAAGPITFIGTSAGSFALTVCVKVWRDTPASVLILLAGMQSIDSSQYEAAMTMGASRIQSFFYVTVPLLAPSISSVLTLRSIEAWKEFVFPYILSPAFPLLSVIIDTYYNQMRNPGLAAVVGIILIASIIIFGRILKFLILCITKYLVRV
jgi:ABC-type sugar transport system permease subunit